MSSRDRERTVAMDFVTRQEREQLEARLSALKANRHVLSQRINDARELGDLKENGEYHAAREQQGLEEAEIRRLEDRLSRVQIIDESKRTTDVVFLGSTVTLRDVSTNKTEVFKIVGEYSQNPPDDVEEVTTNSPMGEALMTRRVGEEVRVNAPRGTLRFEIVEIA